MHVTASAPLGGFEDGGVANRVSDGLEDAEGGEVLVPQLWGEKMKTLLGPPRRPEFVEDFHEPPESPEYTGCGQHKYGEER